MDLDALDAPILDADDGVLLDPTGFVIFDNDGMTADRYTLFPYLDLPGLTDAGHGVALALSPDPDQKGGVSEWLVVSARAVKNHTIDLGRQIAWSDLPVAVKTHVRARLSEDGGVTPGLPPRDLLRSRA